MFIFCQQPHWDNPEAWNCIKALFLDYLLTFLLILLDHKNVLSDGNNMTKSVSPFLPDPLTSCIFSPNNCSQNALASSRVADAAMNCNLLLQIRFSLFMI